MKTVIFDSRVLEEGVLLNSIPKDLIDSADRNKTSYGNNPAFPETFDGDFVSSILNKRFSEIKNELAGIGRIDFVRSTNPEEALSELINKCIEIEEPNREKLETMCYNAVVDMFGIPEGMVNFEIELTKDIDYPMSIQADKVSDEDGELDSIEYADVLKSEVYKRRIINALCVGASMELSKKLDSFIIELYKINPILPELYRDIIALNNYLLLSKKDFDISDKNKRQLGFVNVKLTSEDYIPTISCQAKIFPILYCETIKGVMDLAASHGFSDDEKLLKDTLLRADYLKAEPWDMRIGPSLWRLIIRSIGKVRKDTIPYIFRRICMLDTESFNKLMKSVFATTKQGKKYMSYVVEKAFEDYEENSDETKSKKLDVDKTVITDEFIHEEEL